MQDGTGAGGSFASALSTLFGYVKGAAGFLGQHKKILVGIVASYVTWKTVTLAVSVYQKAAAKVTAAHTAILRIQNSTIVTWLRVKALEVGAWIRSTSATVAATAAAVANRVVYGVGYLTTWLGVKALELTAWVRSTAATIAATAATVGHTAITMGASAATKVWAATQWLLNAAMSANPIGIIVVLIAALVAAVIIAWKKSDKFRAVVMAAWSGIKTVIGAVVGWFTGTAWPALQRILALLSSQFKAVWTTVSNVVRWIRDKWNAMIPSFVAGLPGRIRSKVSGMWDGIKDSFTPSTG